MDRTVCGHVKLWAAGPLLERYTCTKSLSTLCKLTLCRRSGRSWYRGAVGGLPTCPMYRSSWLTCDADFWAVHGAALWGPPQRSMPPKLKLKSFHATVACEGVPPLPASLTLRKHSTLAGKLSREALNGGCRDCCVLMDHAETAAGTAAHEMGARKA